MRFDSSFDLVRGIKVGFLEYYFRSRLKELSNKMKLNYLIEGKGPVNLVWVHGFCGDLHVWDEFIPNFKNYTNLRFDYLGHGESDKNTNPINFMTDSLNVINEVITKNLDGPIVWVGHSFAGNLICPLADSFETTKAIVLIDCGLSKTEEENTRKKIGEQWDKENNLEQVIKDFYLSLLGPSMDRKKKNKLIGSLSKCSALFLKDLYKNFVQLPEFPKNKIPAYIIEAENYSVKDKSFIQYFPDAKREVEKGAYHFFFYEKPELYSKKIQSFIQELSS